MRAVAPGRHALAVVRARPERAGVGGVVDERDVGCRDLLAVATREERPALQQRLAVERARQHPEHRSGHERIEHNRNAAARNGLGPEQPDGSLDRVAWDLVQIQRREIPPCREPVPRLRSGTVVGERDDGRRARRATRVGLDPERVRDRAFGERVAVPGRLDAADTPVRSLGDALEVERDAHLFLRRHRTERFTPQVERRREHPRNVGGAREPVELVRLAERRVVARFLQRLLDDRRVE